MIKRSTNNRITRPNYLIRSAGTCLFCLAMLASPVLALEIGSGQGHDDGCGFYLGLEFIGSSLHADNQTNTTYFIKDDGGGALLKVGYHFTPTFALEFSAGGARHETSLQTIDANMAAAQIFALYRFSPDRPFRPYIKGGFGGYSLILQEGSVEARIEGGGVSFGGGFDYFFSSHFSLGVDFIHNVIQYEEFTLSAGGFSANWDIDEDGSMSSLGLALTYHF
jgi:hypothetical protein